MFKHSFVELSYIYSMEYEPSYIYIYVYTTMYQISLIQFLKTLIEWGVIRDVKLKLE